MDNKKPRVPGMVWTIVAFVPWIVYWVLAGTGNTTAAILSGLGVSLAINGYRIAIRKVKILDAVSLVFLAISTFVTLALRSDVLVFYGGVLSDVTLALVAWGSLLAGNPFTYDYAKEDWDKAFWDNPIFIETNQIITAAWGVVFTAQAISGATSLALGLQGTVRILLVAIIPRVLLVGAIVFTVWFPKWYPARAAARQTRRNAASRPGGMTGLELVQSMPLAFNAQAAVDMRAVIQFDLSGEGGGTGYLKIEAGRCTFHTGRAEQSTLTIVSPAHVWVAISEGRMSGAEAFMNGAYTTTGDLGVLMQLERLFSREGSTL